MTGFFNPYAFVPPWPRRRDVQELRDRPPELHERRWSGRLRLRITAVTPLLITEQGRDAEGPTERGTRCVAGTPLLASSSLQIDGMRQPADSRRRAINAVRIGPSQPTAFPARV